MTTPATLGGWRNISRVFDFNQAIYWIDFDGVLVDSNDSKEDAFSEIARNYFGDKAATDLISFHTANPGLSRFAKISYLLEKNSQSKNDTLRQNLLVDFSVRVQSTLKSARRSQLVNNFFGPEQQAARILSAAPTTEILGFCKMFNWEAAFKERVYGSPETKSLHLQRQLQEFAKEKGIVIGDSKSDFQVASLYGLKFVFISGWTKWTPSVRESRLFFGSFDTLDCFLESSLRPLP